MKVNTFEDKHNLGILDRKKYTDITVEIGKNNRAGKIVLNENEGLNR